MLSESLFAVSCYGNFAYNRKEDKYGLGASQDPSANTVDQCAVGIWNFKIWYFCYFVSIGTLLVYRHATSFI